MKAISRWLDRFCYNHPNFGIPNLMKYIVIGNVLIYFLDMFSNGYVSWALGFYPGLIFQGQIWRLITFVFIPESSGFILWFVMTTLLYYYIGNILERQWGTTRFTVFYGLGVLLNIIVGLVIYGINYAQLSGAGIPADQIQKTIDAIEREIFNREEKEISSSVIGEIVMDKLRDLDPVAYVRFASVYREFKDVNTFMDELKKMLG